MTEIERERARAGLAAEVDLIASTYRDVFFPAAWSLMTPRQRQLLFDTLKSGDLNAASANIAAGALKMMSPDDAVDFGRKMVGRLALLKMCELVASSESDGEICGGCRGGGGVPCGSCGGDGDGCPETDCDQGLTPCPACGGRGR